MERAFEAPQWVTQTCEDVRYNQVGYQERVFRRENCAPVSHHSDQKRDV